MLPKVLKLKYPNIEYINDLTSRGIKASMADPINAISSILAEVSKELYKNLQIAFKDKFGRDAPPKIGSKEAAELLKNERLDIDDWKRTLEVNGDFSDMYSNAVEQDVSNAYRLCFLFTKMCKESRQYILMLVHIILTFNFFKEPTGIFTSENGFAMGCRTSAISTDILLLASEFRLFSRIQTMNLLHVIKRYIRFRDDVNSRLQGTPDEVCSVLKDISTKYPKSIDFNIKVTFLHNTFLNLRTYILPNQNKLDISVLRKVHDRHDIVRADSASNPKYVGAALRTSAHYALENTSHAFHRKHQFEVYEKILTHKGYTKEEFKTCTVKTQKNIISKKKSKFQMKKSYGGKITYDSLTNINKHIIRLLKVSGLPDSIALPITVGSKKVKNYVFSKRMFYAKLKKLHEDNVDD